MKNEVRSRTMRAVRSTDTGPEMHVRRLIRALGHRFQIYRKDLPGKPDLVFTSGRKLIFVHGCFWHGHKCKRGARMPKTNTKYWKAKILRNATRDAKNLRKLESAGWRVLTVWECSLKDEQGLIRVLKRFLARGKS